MPLILAVIILALLGSCSAVYQHATVEYEQITVTDKERITASDSSYYLVFTEEGSYQNSDSLWHWKWDSSELYGELQVGSTYNVTTYGWRFGFLSMYPNIVDAVEVVELTGENK